MCYFFIVIFKNFNSRSRVGSDINFTYFCSSNFLFQFTLPCGERQKEIEDNMEDIEISIHAPVWGATQLKNSNFDNYIISIHAPVWGATKHLRESKKMSQISIHAPVWGATIISYKLT